LLLCHSAPIPLLLHRPGQSKFQLDQFHLIVAESEKLLRAADLPSRGFESPFLALFHRRFPNLANWSYRLSRALHRAGVILARLFAWRAKNPESPNPGFLARGSHARGNDKPEGFFYDPIKIIRYVCAALRAAPIAVA